MTRTLSMVLQRMGVIAVSGSKSFSILAVVWASELVWLGKWKLSGYHSSGP